MIRKYKARKYSEKYKSEVVQAVKTRGGISVVSRELGIPISTIHSWVNALEPVVEASNGVVHLNSDNDVWEELERSYKEVEELKKTMQSMHDEIVLLRKEAEVLKQLKIALESLLSK